MKKFLLGSVGLAAMLAGPAMAADMRVAPPPPPVAYYDWSGAYIGGNVGGVWYDHTRSYTGAPPFIGPAFNHTTSDSDGIFGFHAGAQWQWGAWVLGVEAALSACFDECRSYTDVLPPRFAPNLTHEHKMTNLFTVGPRLGYAWDRWMWFVTGGGASATLKGQTCSNVTGLCGLMTGNGQTRDQWGWYVGTGFDYMVHKGSLTRRRDPRRRVPALRGEQPARLLRQSGLRGARAARLRSQCARRHRTRPADHQDAGLWVPVERAGGILSRDIAKSSSNGLCCLLVPPRPM